MPNYYDQILSMLLESGEYGGNQQALARADASVAEDDRFKSLTKRKRKLGKNERTPDGAYALARYPQLGIAMMQASQGLMAPGGNAANIGLWMKDHELGADPYAPMKRTEERKRWAAEQMRLLGGW